jgi:hypothetical protein
VSFPISTETWKDLSGKGRRMSIVAALEQEGKPSLTHQVQPLAPASWLQRAR